MKQDTARIWDWLTALSPMVLLMVLHYRWQAVATVVVAAGGYVAVSVLWSWWKVQPYSAASGLLCGVLVTACLPATVSLWLGALAGVVAGVVGGVPALYNHLRHEDVLRLPVFAPALTGYVLVRWLFAAQVGEYTLPVMWAQTDAVASATPLAALHSGAEAAPLAHLFWGVEAGSMGGGTAPALLLGCMYLVLRRRVRLWAPLSMVAVTALLSWLIWDGPLYGLLAGGALLAALLLGDGLFVSVGWKGQLTAGAVAAVTTVFCRLWWHRDGAAVGLLLCCLLIPLLHVAYHRVQPHLTVLLQKFTKRKNKG